MEKYYFTFGCGINDPHRNCYHIEIAENYREARERMIDKFGINWAFQYTEDDWKISPKEYNHFLNIGQNYVPYYEGITQAEMFNLKEI